MNTKGVPAKLPFTCRVTETGPDAGLTITDTWSFVLFAATVTGVVPAINIAGP